MFEKFNERVMGLLQYFSKTRFIVALGIAFLAINIFVLAPIQAQLMALSGGVGVIDILPWYSPEEALQRLNVYGVEGRKLHLIATWTGDLVYPAIYSLFFGAIIYRLGGNFWALLGVYSCIIDWFENIAISVMLVQFPTFNASIAQVSAILTGVKWSLALSNIMMIVVFLIIKIRNWLKKNKPDQKLAQ
jgi:hypothetical protein